MIDPRVRPDGAEGPPASVDAGDCPSCEDQALLEAAEKIRRGLRGALAGVEQLIALVTARAGSGGVDTL